MWQFQGCHYKALRNIAGYTQEKIGGQNLKIASHGCCHIHKLLVADIFNNKFMCTIHGMLEIIVHNTVELTLSSLRSSIEALKFGIPYSSFKTSLKKFLLDRTLN